MGNNDETEKLVGQHIANGDNNAAVKLLFKMIVQCAEEKNFIKAEQLRERLLEVDPMALDEIISSAEARRWIRSICRYGPSFMICLTQKKKMSFSIRCKRRCWGLTKRFFPREN